MEALLLKATFHNLFNERDEALKDFGEVIDSNDADVKVPKTHKIRSVIINQYLGRIQHYDHFHNFTGEQF